jgi:TIR domain-containing protein
LKVFVSWSGPISRGVAKAISDWLGLVAQHVEPWMSDAEIKSGDRWNETVARSLDETDFGLVCVTKDNQSAPWLMFESGALAKRLETARLVPLCIDLTPAEITSPLQSFQGRCTDEDGMRQLVHELSELAPHPRKSEEIDRLFQAMWPSLKSGIDEAKSLGVEHPRKPNRTPEDMLTELVTRVRSLEHSADRGGPSNLDSRHILLLAQAVEQLDHNVRRLPSLLEIVDRLNFAASASALADDEDAQKDRRVFIQPDPISVEPGDRVIHDRYGAGVVLQVEGTGPGKRAQVKFKREEIWLILRHAPMRHDRSSEGAEEPEPE